MLPARTILPLSVVYGVCQIQFSYDQTDESDGLRTIYRAEGTRGLYKGSLLALVGVSNGSIQFATYEEIKRRRTDIKRKLFAKQGRDWRIEEEKLVSEDSQKTVCFPQAEEGLYRQVGTITWNHHIIEPHIPIVYLPTHTRATYSTSYIASRLTRRPTPSISSRPAHRSSSQ